MQVQRHMHASKQLIKQHFHGLTRTKRKALPTRPAVQTPAGTAEQQQLTAVSEEQHTDIHNDQAAHIRKLRQDAFEAGFRTGYQKGVQVQVSVSVHLDDDSGSYLRRQQQSLTRSSVRQPWLPQGRQQQETRTQAVDAARASAAAAAAGQAGAGSAETDSSNSTGAGVAGQDSIVRSAIKGLVWRVFSTSATVSVALLLLHDRFQVSDALKFGGIEFVTKYVLYFLHERLWAAIALL